MSRLNRKPRSRSPEQVAVRTAVMNRDRGCRLAGSTLGPCFGALTVHHLWKEGQGGEWSMRGLLTLCQHHNDTIETMDRADAEAWGVVVAWGMTYEEAWRRLVVAGIVCYWWDGSAAFTSPMPDADAVLIRGQRP